MLHRMNMVEAQENSQSEGDYALDVDRRGFAIVARALDLKVVEALRVALAQVARPGRSRQSAGLYAIRNLMEVAPAVRQVAEGACVRQLVEPALGPGAFPVQGIYFDKPPDANWKVPWHQDLTIPVRARAEAPGFGRWSVKGGVPHVQAPAWLLERMLIVRLHLDGCTEENGALRVIRGSHRHGRLSPAEIERLRRQGEEVICEVPRGGALVMRPLLLHASSAARVPGHRRVIHLAYAADPLPDGLAWYHSPPCCPEGA